jgi:hypothetical protein
MKTTDAYSTLRLNENDETAATYTLPHTASSTLEMQETVATCRQSCNTRSGDNISSIEHTKYILSNGTIE